jgi:adenylate cyclase
MTSQPPERMEAATLAAFTNTTADNVLALTELGVLRPGQDGRYEVPDATRVRLVNSLTQAGIPLEAIGTAIAAGALSFDFVSDLPFAGALSDLTVRQQAEHLGLPVESLIRIYGLWGLPQPGPDDRMREDDRIIFEEWIRMMQIFDLDEPTLTRSAYLVGEAMRAIVRWTFDFLEEKVGEPTRAAGGSQMDVVRFAAQASPVSVPSVERQLNWMYRRETEHASIQFIVEAIEGAIEEAGITVPKQAHPPAILFADLSDYTGLTERLGDRAAAAHADTLAWTAQRLAVDHRGRLVKRMGDGVMLHFADPADAVRFGLDLGQEMPDAHIGIAAGPVIVREGDYFGRTVNLAARVLGRAAAGEVLVTPDVAATAGAPADGVVFETLGAVVLKGFAETVEILRAVSADGADGT